MSDHDKLGPPPIEPLSDIAWSRVERGVFSRLDVASPSRVVTARRRWPWVLVPALAAAAAMILLLVTRHDREHPATDDTPSRVVAGAAPSEISIGDIHITLEAQSAIGMSRDPAKPVATLERGAAWFTVASRAGRPAFVVLAGDATIRVVGTRFRVMRDVERTDVEVEHGLVDVQFRGREVRVGAGQHWTSDRPSEVLAIASTDAPTTNAVIANRAAPAGEPAQRLEQPRPDRPSKPDVTTTTRAPAVVTPTRETDREKYERLAALEVTDPQSALTGYLELSGGSGRWSAVALYAAGRLAADRNDRRAKTFLEVYVKRFPKGENVTDAKQLLQRLQAKPM